MGLILYCTFFRGHKIGPLLSITDSSREVVSYWQKNCKVLGKDMHSFGTVPMNAQCLWEYAKEQIGLVNCLSSLKHLLDYKFMSILHLLST